MASMPPTAPMTEAMASSETEWNENKIQNSLNRLQNMHIQLRQVRGTIPRLVEPLLLQFASPEDLYMRYSQNALETGKEIRHLADLMENSQSQEVLQRAKDSRAAEPDGIRPWIVSEHPDWLEVRSLDVESETLAPGINHGSLDQAGQNPSTILDKFKADHPRLDVKFQEGSSKIIEMNLPPPAPIHFQIDLDSSPPMVTCKQTTKIHLGILRMIAARPNDASLSFLLEMMASYDGVRSKPCVKCIRILDRNAQFPIARVRQGPKPGQNSTPSQWQAFHEDCIWIKDLRQA